MDGAGLVCGYGKGGFANHGAKGLLTDPQGVLVFYFRQFRVVLGGEGRDVVGGVAAGQAYVQALVGGKGDDVIGQAADDFTEEAGGENQGSLFGDVCFQGGADAGLHVVAGNCQLAAGLEQDALQGRDGAFCRYSPGGGGNGGLKKELFAGKFHCVHPFVFFGRSGMMRR